MSSKADKTSNYVNVKEEEEEAAFIISTSFFLSAASQQGDANSLTSFLANRICI